MKKAIITGITGQDGAYLAELIVAELCYEGELLFDTTKPDGTTRKLMDTSKINNLGWTSKINLVDGITKNVIEYENKVNRI